jgi:two-component system response regulator FlrC
MSFTAVSTITAHHNPLDRSAVDPVAVADVSCELLSLARRVALSDCTVLLAGESGVGKEVLARYIHRNSKRAGNSFVAVNCAAIPEQMLEGILFGWERGAFTGAHAAHPGKFEQAQGGTLLLDEITEMPMALQAKLLRVLQEREVERLGGSHPIALEVRVLATTNRQLRAEVAAGRFREDLYYRINVFPLELAPLRDRTADILPLAMRLLADQCRSGARIPALSADAGQCLLTHPWPGNVRELDNVMQRALVLCDAAAIEPQHLRFEAPSVTGREAGVARNPAGTSTATQISSRDLAGRLNVTEQQIIIEALRSNFGSRERVARGLGISPRTLRYKLARMREAGVDLNTAVGSAA